MGKRGPRPSNTLKAVDIKPQDRINPPEGMNDRDRALFRRIVSKMPAAHFTTADVPLLREYCEAAGRSKDAEKLIQEYGLLVPAGINGTVKANPAVSIRTAAAAIMAQMAVKLRLCPSSRTAAGSRPEVGSEDKPKSPRSGLMFGGQ